MKRTKLQSMVRAAVTAPATVSTEGFLGDLVDSVKKLFTGDGKILTKQEIKNERVAFYKIADRLKETILNDQWLEAAKLTTSPITANWAIPGTDYKASFDSTDPLKHFNSAVADTTKLAKLYADIIAKHSTQYRSVYSKLIKQVVKAKGNSELLDKAVSDADTAFAQIAPVKESLKAHPIDALGNCHTTLTDGKLDKTITPSKVQSLPPLTKDQLKALASTLLKLIEADLDGKIFKAADYFDWDGAITHDLKDAYGSYDFPDELEDIVASSKLVQEGYDQNAFDDSAIASLLSAIDLLYIRPLMWMNASIK